MLRELNISYSETALGERVRAAGALLIAEDTGQMLLVFRSCKVTDACTWCTPGGKIEDGETEEEACRREIEEEIGYPADAPMELKKIYLYESDSLEFHNFIGMVPSEFVPTLNWESAGYVWCRLDCLPQPQHFGMQAVLEDPFSQGMITALTTTAETINSKQEPEAEAEVETDEALAKLGQYLWKDEAERIAHMKSPGKWGSRSPATMKG